MFIISDNMAENWFFGFFINEQMKKIETVFICSVGIDRCEKSSSIKINMNMTQHYDMLHSDIH